MPDDINAASRWLKQRCPEAFTPSDPRFQIAKSATELAKARGISVGDPAHLDLVDAQLSDFESDLAAAKGEEIDVPSDAGAAPRRPGGSARLSAEEMSVAQAAGIDPQTYAEKKRELQKLGMLGRHRHGY
jgi:hypothetical protein